MLAMLGIEQGMDPAQVAAMPRFHHQYLPDKITMEPGAASPATIAALQGMGYTIAQDAQPWTYYLHVVEWDLRSNVLRGGADPRNPPGSATVVLRKPGAAK